MKFYRQDKIYSKILENPKSHAKFGVKEGLIFMKNNLSRDMCSNYRVEIGAVGIKNLEDLANRNSSVTVRTLIY